MKWIPHDYQRKAIRFIIDKACAGLFLLTFSLCWTRYVVCLCQSARNAKNAVCWPNIFVDVAINVRLRWHVHGDFVRADARS